MLCLRGNARRITVAAAALAAAVCLAAPAASADTTRTRAQTFAAQAAAAGLSASEATAVQAKVDRYIDQLGGTQTSANRIAFDSGQLIVALPGEKHARDLGAAKSGMSIQSPSQCHYKFFCGWKGTYYTGDFWERAACNKYHEIPNGWNSGGSWWNNQTDGTVARMYNKSYRLVYQTPPAGQNSYDAVGDWGPVWYVKVC